MAKRTLLLMRHAKSSWKEADLPDRERPLNKRGIRDAPLMGKRLKERGYKPDLLISSPAVRALETAKSVAKAMDCEAQIVIDERLYMAENEDYLSVIGSVDEKVRHLMIFSHNPGIEEFFTCLTGETVAKFPTAACALIEVDAPWSELTQGKLVYFDFPKSL